MHERKGLCFSDYAMLEWALYVYSNYYTLNKATVCYLSDEIFTVAINGSTPKYGRIHVSNVQSFKQFNISGKTSDRTQKQSRLQDIEIYADY